MAGLHTRSAMAAPFSLASAFRSLSIATPKRAFSTTQATQSVPKLPETAPVYPYGPSQWYKQADSGLYGGASIRFGNKISKGRNAGKTRRSWKPNVRRKKIESEALGESVFIKVTRRALRSIYKAKGLDNYLLSDRPTRLKELGPFGWNLRHQIMQTPAIKEKFAKQRKAFGVPEPPSLGKWMRDHRLVIRNKIVNLDIDAMTKPRASPRSTQSYAR